LAAPDQIPSPGEGGFGAEKHNFDHFAALPISVNTNMRQASDALWNFIPLANDLYPPTNPVVTFDNPFENLGK
jgi:hypothetical protein